MQPFAVRRVRIRMDTPDDPTPVVLFVTEDADLLAAADRVLPAVGFEVVTACHAGHALLACLGGKHVDVLVTEMTMRDMPGPQLARRVRRHYPELPVVYLANAAVHDREGSSTPRPALRTDVLARPFTRDDLVHRLETALAGATA